MSQKKNIVTLNVAKCFASRPEIGPKHFDKLKPKPTQTWPETRTDPRSPARLTSLRQSMQQVPNTWSIGTGLCLNQWFSKWSISNPSGQLEHTRALRSINYSPAQATSFNKLMKSIPLNAGSGASSPCSFARTPCSVLLSHSVRFVR